MLKKITYHMNFELVRKRCKDQSFISYWAVKSEKIQLDKGVYFELIPSVDSKTVFKSLTKIGFNNRTAEHQAFKRIVKSHNINLIDISFSWCVVDGVLTLYVADIEFEKHKFKSAVDKKKNGRFQTVLVDNTYNEFYGYLHALRYEKADKQNQTILYSEKVSRRAAINKKTSTFTHKAELMKMENRKRAMKATSIETVVNQHADLIDQQAIELEKMREQVRRLQAMLDAAENDNE